MTAFNGQKGTCYQTSYGVHKWTNHGGSYPCTESDPGDNNLTYEGDWCMMVSVMLAGTSVNGWSQNGNGRDGPQNDDDYPNSAYTVKSHLSVWLK